MNKKLLVTTALASVALTGSALAELSLSANTEVTLRSFSKDTSNVDGATVLGQETNLVFSGGKDLDNGMSLKMGGNFEMDSGGSTAGDVLREVSMIAEGDGMFIGYGRDHGKGFDMDSSVVPAVGDENDTLTQATSLFAGSFLDVHAADNLRVGFDVLGGTVAAYYAPEIGSAANDAGAVSNTKTSAYHVGYRGNLGIEGLSFQAGYANSDDDKSTTTGKSTASKVGIAYNLGQFAIGGDIQDFELDATNTGSAVLGKQAKRVNATFAANDNLAIGISYTEAERSLGIANSDTALNNTTEEITAVTVGYNIAGMGFNISYADITDLGGVKNTDATAWQIQTKQNF